MLKNQRQKASRKVKASPAADPHEHHQAIVKRLKRAEGHLRSVIAMIEAGRSCLDVAPQLLAVEQAISNAKTEFVRDHIDHCLTGSTPEQTRKNFEELKAITKYL